MFNFHGKISANLDARFKFDRIIAEPLNQTKYVSPYLIEINSHIIDNNLKLNLRINQTISTLFNLETIQLKLEHYFYLLKDINLIKLNSCG